MPKVNNDLYDANDRYECPCPLTGELACAYGITWADEYRTTNGDWVRYDNKTLIFGLSKSLIAYIGQNPLTYEQKVHLANLVQDGTGGLSEGKIVVLLTYDVPQINDETNVVSR